MIGKSVCKRRTPGRGIRRRKELRVTQIACLQSDSSGRLPEAKRNRYPSQSTAQGGALKRDQNCPRSPEKRRKKTAKWPSVLSDSIHFNAVTLTCPDHLGEAVHEICERGVGGTVKRPKHEQLKCLHHRGARGRFLGSAADVLRRRDLRGKFEKVMSWPVHEFKGSENFR